MWLGGLGFPAAGKPRKPAHFKAKNYAKKQKDGEFGVTFRGRLFFSLCRGGTHLSTYASHVAKKSGIEKLGGYKAWSSGFLAQLSPVHVSVCHFPSLSPEKCQNVALKINNKSHLLKPCLQLRLLLWYLHPGVIIIRSVEFSFITMWGRTAVTNFVNVRLRPMFSLRTWAVWVLDRRERQ